MWAKQLAWLDGSAAYDPPSIAAGGFTTTNIAVNTVMVSLQPDSGGRVSWERVVAGAGTEAVSMHRVSVYPTVRPL